MTQNTLNRFLLDEGIKKELDALSRLMAVREFNNIEPAPDLQQEEDTVDWGRVLLAGSILARERDRESEEAALRIATAAIVLGKSVAVRDTGAILFEKLSNQRAVELGLAREKIEPGLMGRLGVSGRLQSTWRHLENTVLVDSTGELVAVNRFQREFWESAQLPGNWFSASAPTASGKTYIVLRRLLDAIAAPGVRFVVYLAPTRALVSEIAEHLEHLIEQTGVSGVDVASLPLKGQYTDSTDGSKKTIFVLTQERLHLLANAMGSDFRVDMLVVDEAHKVGDRLRGVVLQDAIERVARLNPGAQVVFVSPATQNPSALLADAPEGLGRVSIDSDSPTVIQNVILTSHAPRKPMKWDLRLQRGDALLSLGTLTLAAQPSSFKKRLAFVAAAATDGGTLVYANGAAEAEDVALLISQVLPKVSARQPKDPELVALAKLIKKGVHAKYGLAPLVEDQVAFHYGNMPTLIRTEVERLFRLGKIRYLVCTSTLIEGVNLSCRNIVVRGPRKGKGKPMKPHDFWNLAGRAGRWGDEFQGNIICLDPGNTDAWPNGVPKRERYPIVRETDSVLSSSETLLAYIDARWNAPMAEVGKEANSQYEQVSAYLLSTFIRTGSITHAPFSKRHDAEIIERLNRSLADLAARITLPAQVIVRHPGVNAVGMQRLLSSFVAYGDDVEALLPAPPGSDDAYARMVAIMERINAHVYPAFSPATLVPLHALVTNEWLRGLSLAAIIQARIRFNQRNGRSFELPKLIRDTMALVEQTARFLAPKFVSAYMDVLGFHLGRLGKAELITNEYDIGVMLEFGLSSRTLMSLMELGLSRMSAVELFERIADDNLDQAGVRAWIEAYGPRLESFDIPLAIIREVRSRIGGVSAAPQDAGTNNSDLA